MAATPTHRKIRLLLADDHPVVRAGIRSYLSNNQNMEIVGEAGDGSEAISKVRELRPDVVFMDTNMPRMSGLEAAKLLSQQLPNIKILMHCAHNSHESVLQIIRSGARGYVLKNAPPEELALAIERVNKGDTYYDTEAARLALDEHSRISHRRGRRPTAELTEREREVLKGIAEGRSNREIGEKLGIGVRTIETHRERIMNKLQIHNVAGLIKFAIARGLVSLE